MFLTFKILVRRGLEVFSSPKMELGKVKNEKTSLKNIISVVKNTTIAFFSFVVHRILRNLPSLPRAIKHNVRNNNNCLTTNTDNDIFQRLPVEKILLPVSKYAKKQCRQADCKILNYKKWI